jgi:hypothetical protein
VKPDEQKLAKKQPKRREFGVQKQTKITPPTPKPDKQSASECERSYDKKNLRLKKRNGGSLEKNGRKKIAHARTQSSNDRPRETSAERSVKTTAWSERGSAILRGTRDTKNVTNVTETETETATATARDEIATGTMIEIVSARATETVTETAIEIVIGTDTTARGIRTKLFPRNSRRS